MCQTLFTLAQVLSCEFCEIFKNTYFDKSHPQTSFYIGVNFLNERQPVKRSYCDLQLFVSLSPKEILNIYLFFKDCLFFFRDTVI